MPDPQPTPRPTYDANELRRCIALCFSPKDLRSFAENLGVTGLGSWDRGIQDGAREVVRHYERLGTLDTLVAKLAEARPLMEWPAPVPQTLPSPYAPPAPPAATVPDAPAAEPALTATTAEPGAAAPPVPVDAAPRAPAAPAATHAPFAPQIMTLGTPVGTPVAPVKPAATLLSAGQEPVIRDPFAPAWPGTAASAATNPQRVEGKKLAPLLGGAMVLITLVTIGIFLAVRVGKNPEATSSPSEVVAGRPLRPDGPARLAADAMKRSLESLARGCDLELPRGTDVGVWLFSAAYGQCGSRLGIAFPPQGLRVDKPRSLNAPDDDPDSSPNAQGGATPRQTNPGRNTGPRPAAPAPGPGKPAASDGCLDKCASAQRQCDKACGREPSGASEFDRWQGCKTQCLSTASKCRLGCQ